MENKLRLILPPAIYAVSGHEMNLYFDNIILTTNIKNYSFDVDCKHGRQDQDRWRFVPTDADVGDFPLSIKIYDEAGALVGEGSTTVHVAPAGSGKDRSISVMLVGDSLTAMGDWYPAQLDALFKKPGNPNVRFVGSYAGEPGGEGLPLIEGYGGWTWGLFLTRWVEGKPSGGSAIGSSPFLVLKDGKPVLDFKAYCDRKNGGKAPDFIVILLGINDIFGTDDSNIGRTLDAMFKNADMLIGEFRRVGPDTKIAIGVEPPPAASQDGFGERYKCGVPRFQHRKNQHLAIERTIAKFAGREKENIFLIPVFSNLDCVNNFPQREEPANARCTKKVMRDIDGVHPSLAGFHQISDSFYAWFKYELGKNK